MNLFVRSLSVGFLVCITSVVFGMQQNPKPYPRSSRVLTQLRTGAGIFDTLPKEVNYPIFAKLAPAEKNSMRKTCKALSTFLSFYYPSDLIGHTDFCAHKKDISSIFVKAAFDRHLELVKCLCMRYGSHDYDYHCIERKCSFVVINRSSFMCLGIKNELTISPYFMACYNKDTQMAKLLEEPRLAGLSSGASESSVMPMDLGLLIACISRNTQRIVRVMNASRFIHSSSIEHCLAVIIANDDESSLSAFMQNKKVVECIKKNGVNFLNVAIFGRYNKVAQVLIKSGHFDLWGIMEHTFEEEKYGWTYQGTYLDFIKCCEDHFEVEHFILSLLMEYAAKDKVSVVEQCLVQ